MEIGEEEFREKIAGGGKFVADFFAVWCPPCKGFAPIFEKAGKIAGGACSFVKIDVDKCPEVSEEYGIRSVPTVILFDKGSAVDTHIGGFKTAEGVLQFIRL